MTIKRKNLIRKGNLGCPPPPFMKVKEITQNIHFKQKLTGSAPSERTAPSLDRNLDKTSCSQV